MLTNHSLGCRITFNSVIVVFVGLIHHAKISWYCQLPHHLSIECPWADGFMVNQLQDRKELPCHNLLICLQLTLTKIHFILGSILLTLIQRLRKRWGQWMLVTNHEVPSEYLVHEYYFFFKMKIHYRRLIIIYWDSDTILPNVGQNDLEIGLILLMYKY